ncbi:MULTISPECIES: ABC transporter ATP-binding protein [Mycobacteriaceae]|uniref:ABC transporter ATP-binding protein n=1 Tax=Mycolicibacterium neoaurum VKM Ac-1815D TaxID=700508 RepID=V5XBE9_MYCNE|nr:MULTISPECIES: ABC transporter ATP-binding protein [Mycobacteriaceae]AHC25775.1 ABC transporter ATP-binding protein [Mycolicibacterium neoaurum VKM Ac-1815D]AMO06195.1 ABC transporter ATP-binding protein [Mycolicibacterium neoaurum]AXK75460.1 ABC transporter ATP-binding protein [Mycolicibacterium neoaurum]KJQ50308.1 ABC transporter ATP-binding protein [Mycolicibacterium neoaurum]KUM09466.1 ABC transporter ATP-binding protein [Mycolicibacterium neoaurum]
MSVEHHDSLRIEGLRVTIAGTEVLHEVSLVVRAGETVAVVGSSGSGKTTLARTLVGLHRHHIRVDADRLEVAGEPLRRRGWRRRPDGPRVGYVPQDPGNSLNPVYRVGTQLAEALRAHGIRPHHDLIVQRLLEVGLGTDRTPAASLAQRYPHELSGGQRQRVLIAIALAGRPALIVADEPTSALDAAVATRVLDTLVARSRDGAGLLLITHDLAVAASRADRIVVLDGGRVVEDGGADTVLESPRSDAAQELAAALPGRRRRSPVASDADIALRADRLTKRFGVVHALADAELTVRRGETVAVVGESGSGKSTLARVLVGLATPDDGRLTLAGADGGSVRPGRIQLVAQNPFTALDPRWTVGRIVSESLLRTVDMDDRTRRERVREVLSEVGLGEQFLTRKPGQLSGGQSQRVAIARALAPGPDIVVLDEAVSALDVVAQAAVLDTLVALQERYGTAMVFITHDLDVARDIGHRIVECRAGRLAEVSHNRRAVIGS